MAVAAGLVVRGEGSAVGPGAVTRDRWFLRSLDRFLVFREDGEVEVHDHLVEPVA